MARIPVLILDELGKGKNSEWEMNIIDKIIHQRYNAKKKTIFTTNYSFKIKGAKKKKRETICNGKKPTTKNFY